MKKTILIAVACGIPVVVWDYNFYRKIYPQGLISVEPGNLDKFADAISMLLNSNKLTETISREGLELSREYDWQKVASRELQYLEKALKHIDADIN